MWELEANYELLSVQENNMTFYCRYFKINNTMKKQNINQFMLK